MEFWKLHGLGNDFLIVRVPPEGFSQPMGTLARTMCERRTGIGADGVVYYQPTTGDKQADFSALIFNADGSKAEISGNGIRCLAAKLVQDPGMPVETIRIRTVAGIRTLQLLKRQETVSYFRCTMGQPITDPGRIPVSLADASDPILEWPLSLGDWKVGASIISMGNPHCSTFWSDVATAMVATLGPQLETHRIFPRKANVEFIQVLDRNQIRVRFWERGVGITLASGSGSCAAAVVSILRGLVDSPVTVLTEIGQLIVEWDGKSDVFLSGPAALICSGTIPSCAS